MGHVQREVQIGIHEGHHLAILGFPHEELPFASQSSRGLILPKLKPFKQGAWQDTLKTMRRDQQSAFALFI